MANFRLGALCRNHHLPFVVCFLAVQSYGQPNPQPNNPQRNPSASVRGTQESPVYVNVLPSNKTQEESANEKRKDKDQSDANWWMVRLTGIAAAIALIQAIVFGVQARRLKQTIQKMDEIARAQTNDVRASIAEATKAAREMGRIADAMNQSVESVRISVGISREIADRQKLITELQSRAYITILFEGMIAQNPDTGVRFEPVLRIHNQGNTPAYNIGFAMLADVLPFRWCLNPS